MSKLRLTGTQKLQVVLSGAATASRVTVSYMDFTATAVTGGTQLSVTNGATPVDICDAPAASTTRQIDHIKLVAKAAMTATFSVNDGTAEEWDTVTLASGDVFEWGGNGAFVKDSGGNIKRVIGGAVAATTIAASGLATFNAGATVASGQTLTLTGATVAGTPTWSSSQAITLSTAAQPNVTSLGTLTSLTSSGAISTTLATDSASSTTGSGIFAGGVGIAKKLFIGTNLDVIGVTSDSINPDSYTNTAIRLDGGYIAFRFGTAHDFNIDTYNAASQKNVLKITQAGVVTIPSLAGTGTRAVVVDANGVMSAP